MAKGFEPVSEGVVIGEKEKKVLKDQGKIQETPKAPKEKTAKVKEDKVLAPETYKLKTITADKAELLDYQVSVWLKENPSLEIHSFNTVVLKKGFACSILYKGTISLVDEE
jgi:hypothetical protein